MPKKDAANDKGIPPQEFSLMLDEMRRHQEKWREKIRAAIEKMGLTPEEVGALIKAKEESSEEGKEYIETLRRKAIAEAPIPELLRNDLEKFLDENTSTPKPSPKKSKKGRARTAAGLSAPRRGWMPMR